MPFSFHAGADIRPTHCFARVSLSGMRYAMLLRDECRPGIGNEWKGVSQGPRMDTLLSVALSHQVAKRRQMDVIANNLANMNTIAFKREGVMFTQFLQKANGDADKSLRQISYVLDYGLNRNITDGKLETTGNQLDIALSGEGMFQVKRDNGEMAYSRNGHLALSSDYTLVTSSGHEIMDDKGKAIQLPPNVNDIKITSDGIISSPGSGVIAKLNVVTFQDDSTLKKIGDNMFSTNSPALPAEDFKITQGATELSNIQPILELTRMIDVSRSYIQTARLMDNLQEAQSRALNQLAKVG